MAIKLGKLSEGTLEVVASIDSALDMTEAEYDAYLDSLDPSLIKLKDGEKPTVFVLRKVLKYGVSQRIKGRQITYDSKDKEAYVGSAHITEEVRAALVDIRNPPDNEDPIKFKQAGDGGAMPDLMSLLDAAGITADLFTARTKYLARVSGGNEESVKKSSVPS